MTFEEFFYKKKIDLDQLQKAEGVLFAEFKSHYEQMGEKSFDHSKKFWFNKLRRLYHIKEEPKPAKASIEINEIASQAEPLSSPSTEIKKGFTPRFKAKAPSSPETNILEETKPLDQSTPKIQVPKPGFTPRFKPQMAKPAIISSVNPEQNTAIEAPNLEQSDKPQIINPSEILPEHKTGIEEQSKPAYKPRFKPQMAKPPEPVSGDNQTIESKVDVPATESTPPNPGTETTENSSAEQPKTVFKPKFTPRNFKPKSEN